MKFVGRIFTVVLFFSIVLLTISDKVDHGNLVVKSLKEGNCECIEYDCGCCEYIDIHPVLNGTVCANATYLYHDYGVSLTVTYDMITIINETVSARNPPPVCVAETTADLFNICFRMYDIHLDKGIFYTCFDIELGFHHLPILKKLIKINLGCIHVPGSSWNKVFKHNEKDNPNKSENFKYNVEGASDSPDVVLL